jgi:rod shape-determining protein MreC
VAGQSRGRARSRLMLLVLTAVTLLTLDFRSFGPLATVQRGLRNVLAPVRSGVETVTQPITDGARGIVDYGHLKDENAQLREELERLRGEQVQQQVDADLLRRLLEQDKIDYIGDVPRTVARVVAGSVGNFDPYSVEIDKGSNDGLSKDMPVVTSAGLVGRLVQVDATRSRVQLITSPQFAVGVRIGQEVSLARGTGAGNPLRASGAIPIDAPMNEGEKVFTNGQDRSKFPPDIPVGTVRTVDRSSGTVVVEIDPFANVRAVDVVAVVKYSPAS